MHQKNKDTQKRYEGFLKTPCLWNNGIIYKLSQFKIDTEINKITIDIDEKLRLGKYIERLVSFQLNQEKSISILCENIQIQQEKRTLGELDCIIQKGNTIVHLEIIYKFYLYDSTIGNTELEHFIGPNKKDSLIEKLTKLKEKQLPLLYSNECSVFLKKINLSAKNIKQQVYFKAQLFVPYQSDIDFKKINKNCVVGFYINQNDLQIFSDCKFFIPTKKDWIIIPHQNVNWLNFNQFEKDSSEYLERNFSPLCWLKKSNGEIEKFFLIWWS